MSISLKPIIIKMPERYKEFKKIPLEQNFNEKLWKCFKCGGFVSKKRRECPLCNPK